MRTDHQSGGDLRVPVLLLLAALILAAGWRLPTRNTPPSSYFWAEGKLVRSQAEKGVRLTAGMACADIPAELAAFFHLPLPVNRADQAALLRLPGIGPKLAESVISFRAEHGGITGPDDLIKVKGIGPKRLAKLTPLICFDAN